MPHTALGAQRREASRPKVGKPAGWFDHWLDHSRDHSRDHALDC